MTCTLSRCRWKDCIRLPPGWARSQRLARDVSVCQLAVSPWLTSSLSERLPSPLGVWPEVVRRRLCHEKKKIKNAPEKHVRAVSIIQVHELELLHYLTVPRLPWLVSPLIQICHFTSLCAQGDRALLSSHTNKHTHTHTHTPTGMCMHKPSARNVPRQKYVSHCAKQCNYLWTNTHRSPDPYTTY